MKNNPFDDKAKVISIMTDLGFRIYNPEIFDYLHDILILPNDKQFIERFIELNRQKKLSHFLSLVGCQGQVIDNHQKLDVQILINALKNYAEIVGKILISFNRVLAPEFCNGISPDQKDKLHELYKLYIGIVCSQSMIHFCIANLYLELAQQQDIKMEQMLNKHIEFLTESRKQIFIAVELMMSLFPQKSFLIHDEDKCSFVLSLIFACLPLLLSSVSKISEAMALRNASSNDQLAQQEKLKNDKLLKELNEIVNKCCLNLVFKESAQRINFIIDNHIHFIDKIVNYDAENLSHNIDYAISLMHKNMANKTIVNVKLAQPWVERLLRIYCIHYTNISISDIKKVYALKLTDDIESTQFGLDELNIFYKKVHHMLLQAQKLEKRLRLTLEVVHYILRTSLDITVWPDTNISDKAIEGLSRLLINLDLISQRLSTFVSLYNAILTLISYRHSIKANAELDQWIKQEKTEKLKPLLAKQTKEKSCSQISNSADAVDVENANSNLLEVKKGVTYHYWQQLSQVAKEINAFKKISIQYKETESDLYEKWCYFFVEDAGVNTKNMLTDIYVDQLNLILDKCNALLTVARSQNDIEFEINVIAQMAEAYLSFAEKLFAIFYLNPIVHNHLANKCTSISHMPLMVYLLPEVYDEYFAVMIKGLNYLLYANSKYNALLKNSNTIFNELKNHAFLCLSSNLTYLMSNINDVLIEAERQINCFVQCNIPQERISLQAELRALSILSVGFYIYIIKMLDCLKTISSKECPDDVADYQQVFSCLHEKLINLNVMNTRIDAIIHMSDDYINRINKIDISALKQQWLFKQPNCESNIVSDAIDSPRQMMTAVKVFS